MTEEVAASAGLADSNVSAHRPRRRLGPEATIVSALGIVSILNYAYTLTLVWLLPASDYAVVGSASALLLICGTVSSASLPWVLAGEVSAAPDDASRRRSALAFCGVATLAEALIGGALTALIAEHYANDAAVAAVFGSTFMIFTGATGVGYLQGRQKFHRIATLRMAEVILKIASGIGLVELGLGAGGAIAGFAVGAGAVAAGAFVVMRPDLPRRTDLKFDRALLRDAGGLVAVQGGVAVLASLDVVVASLAVTDHTALATYQVAQILTRLPVFVAAALSMVVFPRLVTRSAPPGRDISGSLSLFLRIVVPIGLVVATAPTDLTIHLFPREYGTVHDLLPWGAAGGIAMGLINLITTFFQAAKRYRRPATVLLAAIPVQVTCVLVGLHLDGIVGIAIGVAAGGLLVSGVLLVMTAQTWKGSTRGLCRQGAVGLVLGAPLIVLRQEEIFWLVWAVAGCGVPVAVSLLGLRHRGPRGGQGRTRVLHLGYEDHRCPGAGGGSRRTHEISRRLAAEFDVTVVCARYRGARSRTEDGVRYVHIGLPVGRLASILSYFAGIPWALVRYRSDLVIEDFGAPWSTVGVPRLTGRPVIGVVQWLFARDKASQYHLPFHLVESLGLRSHRNLIVVSEDIAEEVRSRHPGAEVDVIVNGVERSAVQPSGVAHKKDVAFLGRLETAQKGIDILLEAFAVVCDRIDEDLLLAGDGPDRESLQSLAANLGITDRVHFVGRIENEARFEFLAAARVVVMPSRYESFGLVAAEAMSVGTPVLAFDIPSLRRVVTPDTGVLVTPIDASAYGRALAALLDDPALLERLGGGGPSAASKYQWDRLAEEQGKMYRDVTAGVR